MRATTLAAVMLCCLALSAEEMPFRMAGHALVLPGVKLNGKGPYRMVVDTGSETTTISSRVVDELGLEAKYRLELVSPGGSRIARAFQVSTVELGKTALRNVEVVEDALAVVERVAGRVDGILGQNILGGFDYLMDFTNGKLVISPGSVPGERLQARKTGRRLELPVVVDGSPMWMVLDSGASHAVLFAGNRPLDAPGLLESGAGLRQAGVTRIGRMRVGPLVLRNLTAGVLPLRGPEANGLLPARLFSSVYVDSRAGTVVLNPVK